MAERGVKVTVTIGGNASGLTQALSASQQAATRLQAQLGNLNRAPVGPSAKIPAVPRAVPVAALRVGGLPSAPLPAMTLPAMTLPVAPPGPLAKVAQAAQQQLGQTSAQLAYLRSPAGSAATLQQLTLGRQLAARQDWLRSVSERGRIGAALGVAAERFAPVQSMARTGAVIGGGLVAAGVASLPDTSAQLSNSFAMLSREIGIAVTPAVVRFSGLLQGLSRVVRSINEESGGYAGSTLAYGSLGLGGVSLGGMGINMARSSVSGYRTAAGWLGFGAQAVGPAAGPVLQATAGAAPVAGPAAAAAVPAAAPAVPLLGTISIALAAITADLGRLNFVRELVRDRAGFGANAQRSPWQYALDLAQLAIAPAALLPTRGIVAAYRSVTGGPEAAGMGPQLLLDRQTQMGGDVTALYDRLLMGIQGRTGPQAEQEIRGLQTLIDSIDNLNGTIERINTQPP